MAGSITTDSSGQVGAPTKKTEETVTKLENIFKIGGTVEEACSYALISKETFYRWIKEDEKFMTKMDAAKHYADIAAKNVVIDSFVKNKNVETAKWWLDKREFKNAGIQQNTQVNIFGKLQDEFMVETNDVTEPTEATEATEAKPNESH